MKQKAILFLFIITLLAGCVAEHPEAESKAQAMQTQQTPSTMEPAQHQNASNLTQRVLDVLSIAGVEGEVEMLTPENLSKLAEKYPVIYGNLPNKTLWQVKTKEMLIIVDVEEKKVLRKFRVVGIKLGG